MAVAALLGCGVFIAWAVTAPRFEDIDLRWKYCLFAIVLVCAEGCSNLRKRATIIPKVTLYILLGVYVLLFVSCSENTAPLPSPAEDIFAGPCRPPEASTVQRCSAEGFPAPPEFVHASHMTSLNYSRADFEEAWFDPAFREKLERSFERFYEFDPAAVEYFHTTCLEKFDQLVCRLLLLEPCSASCEPIPSCSSIFCEEDLLVCVFNTKFLLEELSLSPSGYRWDDNDKTFGRVVLNFMDRFYDFSCHTSEDQALCYFMNHTHDIRVAPPPSECFVKQELPPTEQCAGDSQTTRIALAVCGSLMVLFFSFSGKRLNATNQSSNAISRRTRVLTLLPLMAIIISVSLIVLALMMRASGNAWDPPSLLCVLVVTVITRSFIGRVFGLRDSRHTTWIFPQFLSELKVGGRLFVLRYGVVELVEIFTQFIDLHQNLARQLDFRWIVGFSILSALNTLSFLVLSRLHWESTAIMAEIVFDLIYMTMKYYSNSLSISTTINLIEVLSTLVPLYSVAQLCLDFHDLVLRGARPSAVAPTDFFESMSKSLGKNRHVGRLIRDLGAKERNKGTFTKFDAVILLPGSVILAVLSILVPFRVILGVMNTHPTCQSMMTPCLWNNAWPQVYFADGLFDDSSCHVELVQQIDARDCGIEILPEELANADSLTWLDLRGNQLQDIPRWIPSFQDKCPDCFCMLGPLESVTSIDWSHSGLQSFPSQTLVFFPNVTTLNLRGNKIRETADALLNVTPMLQALDVSLNGLSLVHDEFLESFPHLEMLNLSYNDLQFVPRKVLEMYFEPVHANATNGTATGVTLAGNPIKALSYVLRGPVVVFPEDLVQLDKLDRVYIGGKVANTEIGPEHIRLFSQVTGLYLSKLVRGTIPSSISELTKLEELELSWGSLTGTLPDELWSLTSLHFLDLSGNKLTGTIPGRLQELTSLETLMLGENEFTGTIPTELGALASGLHVLYLEVNHLSGTIPTEIGTLSNLIGLDIRGNRLEGTIPAEFGQLESLMHVAFSYNAKLKGKFPRVLIDLPKLLYLDLDACMFSGMIPDEIQRMTSLRYLSLSNNQFSGSITRQLGKLSSLEYLFADNNKHTGTIPYELEKLEKLVLLSLKDNYLHGTIPTEFGQLKKVKELSLSTNMLEGTVPDSLFTLSDLNTLDVFNNALRGTIPDTLGAMKNLVYLDLSFNYFEGTLPSRLGELRKLLHLMLYENSFNGTVPTELGELTQLSSLHLDANSLTGTIPTELAKLRQLYVLFLYKNALSGTVPTELGSLGKKNLLYFALDGNKLSGTLPTELGNLQGLKELWVGDNLLTGFIPGELSNTPLELLDIKKNYFGGTLPHELATRSSLTIQDSFWNQTIDGYETLCAQMAMDDVSTWTDPPQDSQSFAAMVCKDWNFASFLLSHKGTLREAPILRVVGQDITGAFPSGLLQITGLKSLEIRDTSLTGSVPAQVSALTNLETLVLSGNQELSGTIPTGLGLLVALRHLDLSRNGLEGTLPSTLADLSQLTLLDVGNNKLQGTIPSTFGQLIELETLSLNSNSFSGMIPSEIGEIQSLSMLDLSYNYFAGVAQDVDLGVETLVTQHWNRMSSTDVDRCKEVTLSTSGIGSWGQVHSVVSFLCHDRGFYRIVQSPGMNPEQELRLLDLSESLLEGTIPSELGVFTGLEALDFSRNKLTGTIPSEMGLLTSLQRVVLDSNQLHGTLPSELGWLTQVSILSVSENNLVGSLPPEMGALSNLEQVYFGDNAFEGTIPSEFYTLGHLRVLEMRNNALTGSLSGQVGDLWSLEKLSVENNSLTGMLPTELGQVSALTRLEVSSNELTGTLPSELGLLEELWLLDVANNTLWGQLPTEIASIPNIQVVDISFNYFSGTIPSEWSRRPTLFLKNDRWNQTAGELRAPCVATAFPEAESLFGSGVEYDSLLQVICSSFQTMQYIFQGGRFADITELSVSGARLSGTVPTLLGSLSQLRVLDLSNNLFAGMIPSELGQLTQLTLLDLSNNILTGMVPAEVGLVDQLDMFGLSGNQLIGAEGFVSVGHSACVAGMAWLFNGTFDAVCEASHFSDLSVVLCFEDQVQAFVGGIEVDQVTFFTSMLQVLEWVLESPIATACAEHVFNTLLQFKIEAQCTALWYEYLSWLSSDCTTAHAYTVSQMLCSEQVILDFTMDEEVDFTEFYQTMENVFLSVEDPAYEVCIETWMFYLLPRPAPRPRTSFSSTSTTTTSRVNSSAGNSASVLSSSLRSAMIASFTKAKPSDPDKDNKFQDKLSQSVSRRNKGHSLWRRGNRVFSSRTTSDDVGVDSNENDALRTRHESRPDYVMRRPSYKPLWRILYDLEE